MFTWWTYYISRSVFVQYLIDAVYRHRPNIAVVGSREKVKENGDIVNVVYICCSFVDFKFASGDLRIMGALLDM